MPSTRSYQEPTPTITVEYSASTLSRWGFFPVVGRGADAGDGGPGGVPSPDQEDEEGASAVADPELPLRHRDRPAPLEHGQDLQDLQGSLGGGELLQGIEPAVQLRQAPKQPVPGQPVLPGAAVRGVQPDAVVQAGLPAPGLPDDELRHGSSLLPGACGGDRGAG